MSNVALLLGDEPLDTAIPSRRRAPKRRTLKVSEGTVVNAIKSRLALYGCLVQANPNEARSAAAGRGMKIRNTILGFPDLTVIGPDGRTAYLEVKAPGAKPKNEHDRAHWQRQADTRATLARMGHVTAMVRDQDEACAVLRAAGWRV